VVLQLRIGDEMPSNRVSNNMKMPYLLAFVLASGVALVYFFEARSDFLASFSDIFRSAIAIVALIASGFALHNYWENLESTLSRIWLCFTIGMMFWFFSQLSWTILTLGFGINNPYPSIADVYRLVGYVALFAAIFVYMGIFQSVISKKIVAMAATVALPTSAGIIPTILLAARGKMPQVNLTTFFVSVAYPLFDLLLFAQALLGLLVFTTTGLKGRVGGAWLLLNAGILMNVFGDLMLSYTNLNGTYYSGHPLELFFHIGYIFFALAFYTHTKQL
jgi:hypothetical protein